MRVTLIIVDENEQEIARIMFPNKKAFYAATWFVNLPAKYSIEWDEE